MKSYSFYILGVSLVLLSVIASIADCQAGFMVALQKRCCDLGQNYAGRTLSPQRRCSKFDRYPPELSNEEKELCQEIGQMCCLKEVQLQQCTAGRQTAFTRHVCEVPTQEGEETFKECCTCCKLGMAAARLRESCNLLKVGNPCDMAFRECCFNFSVAGPGASSCDRYNPCEQICEEEGSEIKCSCYPGYEPDPSNLFNCIDVDECARGLASCQPHQSCFNKKGSYECLTLPPGAQHANLQEFGDGGEEDGEVTEEEADASIRSGQLIQQPVMNELNAAEESVTSGTPWATCPRGYALNEANDKCLDIDECILYPDICDIDKGCYNTPGGYECRDEGADITIEQSGKIAEICPIGFRLNPINGNCESTAAGGAHRVNDDNLVAPRLSKTSTPAMPLPPPPPPTPAFVPMPSPSSDGIRGYPLPSKLPTSPRSIDCPADAGCSHFCRMVDDMPKCFCNPGYKLADDTNCEDVDECLPSAFGNNCSLVSQNCRNTLGTYLCECKPGFQKIPGQPYECEDVNECALDLDNCETGQRCENTLGSFECRRQVNCPTGYTLDAATQQCQDVDECKLNLHNCGKAYLCYNTRGSFRCERKQCAFGKRLNAQTGECDAVECAEGYKVSPDGQCQDIDECRQGAQCKVYQRCVNTQGSYICQNIYNCPQGYEFSESGHCIDIDECAKGTHECKANQVCTNRPGGHTCSCHPGFELSPSRECVDIDECTRYQWMLCQDNAESCQNTPGSYRCICKSGFRPSTNDTQCIDIDECEESSKICDHNCRNTKGGFQCTCKSGYQLGPDNRTCTDIDECKVWAERSTLLCLGLCQNTEGSYYCKCPPGYTLKEDKVTCQDIDECGNRTADCPAGSACFNIRGGFRCIEDQCPRGYRKVELERRRILAVGEEGVECHRLPCTNNDVECIMNKTRTVTIQMIALPSIPELPQPTVIMTVQTIRGLDAKFSILSGNLNNLFDLHVPKEDPDHGLLRLLKPLTGPREFWLQLLLQSVNKAGLVMYSHIAFVIINFSQYEF